MAKSKSPEIVITDIFATTKRMILCLSADAEPDQLREEVWKNPDSYKLLRITENPEGDLIELTEETISYTNEIPAVIFHMEGESVDEEDWFRLIFQESEPIEFGVGNEPLSDDDETEPEDIVKIEKRVKVTEEKIVVMEDSIKRLEKSNSAASGPLQALEDLLKENKTNLEKSRSKGKALVAEVLDSWQKSLVAFEDTLENRDIKPKVKEKIQELRSYIARKISEISILKGWDEKRPIFIARVTSLKANTISSIDEVLGSIGYLRRSIT